MPVVADFSMVPDALDLEILFFESNEFQPAVACQTSGPTLHSAQCLGNEWLQQAGASFEMAALVRPLDCPWQLASEKSDELWIQVNS